MNPSTSGCRTVKAPSIADRSPSASRARSLARRDRSAAESTAPWTHRCRYGQFGQVPKIVQHMAHRPWQQLDTAAGSAAKAMAGIARPTATIAKSFFLFMVIPG